MDRGQVLLVNLSRGRIGEVPAAIFGALLVASDRVGRIVPKRWSAVSATAHVYRRTAGHPVAAGPLGGWSCEMGQRPRKLPWSISI